MHQTLKTYFHKYKLDGFLITDLNNVRYLSNFTGTNGMILATPGRGYFFTDFRYREQSAKEVKGFKIIESHCDIGGTIVAFLKKHKIKKLGFESGAMNYNQFARLHKYLSGVKLIPVTEDPALIRVIKTEAEVKQIEHALKINKLAFEEIRHQIKPGVKEFEVALMLEFSLREHGAEKLAFDTIVASGWRGALPHGKASTKKIRAGELVTIDFGGVYRGYHADETVTIGLEIRNLPIRQAGSKLEIIHRIVYDAQRYAIEVACPGAKCSDVDKAARDYIAKKGYGQYFGHALGHGVGLEVHERPVLSPNSTDILQEGMVFTIEPGIYIPKFGGVRIEDVFACTWTGVRRLSKIDKKS